MEIANAAATVWVVLVVFAVALLIYLVLRKPKPRYVTSEDQWFYVNLNPPGTAPIKCYIGESVSWHLGSDKDGYAIPIYEEDEETVRKFYKNWKTRETNA